MRLSYQKRGLHLREWEDGIAQGVLMPFRLLDLDSPPIQKGVV